MRKTSILAVFAHPDDEAFRAGGTLALLSARGIRVQILSATRGEAGSPGTPPMCTMDELPALRAQELRCACQALGIEPPIILSYPDGGLSTIDPGEILSDILEAVDRIQPHSILSFGKDGLSGHPDHVAIGKFSRAAFRQRRKIRAFYTLAVPKSIADALGMAHIQALPDDRITHTITISKVWDTKLRAIHCHKTQINESPILKAQPSEQKLFLGKEHFRRTELRPGGSFWGNFSGDMIADLAQ